MAGSIAACSVIACAEIRIPGAITAPSKVPSTPTISYVVAVPKSITITGPPYRVYAATASTIRSAPTCFGFSVTIRIPVLIPADTTIGLIPKYLISALPRECIISGTTDATITSSISPLCIPCRSTNSLSVIPYSSDVLGSFVVMRNVPDNSFPLNTPNVMFVFPTSITNNIFSSIQRAQLLLPARLASPELL